MPPRWMIAGIVLCWAVALGWLLYREILPDLLANEPILYVIETADESKREHGLPPRVYWSVQRNGKLTSYKLQTWVQYDEEEDQFDVACSLNLPGNAEKQADENDHELAIEPGSKIRIRDINMKSHYWVTHTGRLSILNINSEYEFSSSAEAPNRFSAVWQGSPRNRTLAPTVTLGPADSADKTETELEAVDLSSHSCVLNPLHPVQRIREIQPGRVWKCAVADPCALVQNPLQGLLVHTDDDILKWSQTPRPEERPTDSRVVEVPCRHMVFGDENSLMWFETWIRAADGWVLKQETHLWGETWTMTRSTPLP